MNGHDAIRPQEFRPRKIRAAARHHALNLLTWSHSLTGRLSAAPVALGAAASHFSTFKMD